MSLGPHVPAWSNLRERLASLVTASGTREGYVLDAWSNLWCADRAVTRERQEDVIRLVRTITAAVRPPMPRGGRLDRVVVDGEGNGYARSFAGVYVLLLTSPDPIDVVTTRRAIGTALAEIEALTLALPPPEGTHDGGAARFGAA